MNAAVSSTTYKREDFERSSVKDSDYRPWLRDFLMTPRVEHSDLSDLKTVDGIIEVLAGNREFIRETDELLDKLSESSEGFINVGEKYKDVYE